MDFKLLRSFVTIVECGNISAAADVLYTTQPNLSKQLKSLEGEYSVKLIDRSGRCLVPTEEGKLLYNYAKKILSMADTSRREISLLRSGDGGMLTLGVMPTALYAWQKYVFPTFYKRYPNVKYKLYEGSTFDILDNLRAGMFNIGILRTPFNAAGLDTYSFSTDSLAVCYSCPEFFKAWGDTITLDALNGIPLVMIHRIRKIVEPLCIERGFEPDILSVNDQTITNIFWANNLPVCAIVPETILNSIQLPKEMYYKLLDDPSCSTDTVLAVVKGRYLSNIELNFLEALFEIDWHKNGQDDDAALWF